MICLIKRNIVDMKDKEMTCEDRKSQVSWLKSQLQVCTEDKAVLDKLWPLLGDEMQTVLHVNYGGE